MFIVLNRNMNHLLQVQCFGIFLKDGHVHLSDAGLYLICAEKVIQRVPQKNAVLLFSIMGNRHSVLKFH